MKDLTDPTNRDSVPAMLTPGEYVLNKEATEMYGPIIEQMNENGLTARAEGNMGVLSLNTGGSSLRPKARPDKFKPYDLQKGIIETAKILKISPLDLATVISYETAGTFNPLRKGPVTKHGMHKGLIQFGTGSEDGSVAKGSIADEFDVEFNTKNSSLRSQLGYMGEDGNWVPGAIVKHSLARGFNPGEHGVLDLYSSINAGAVGPKAHGKTDEFAGGMPGTVSQKLNTMYEDVGNITHLDRAKSLFPDWMDKGMDHYLPPIITTNETGAVETSINPKSRPTSVEIPQEVQADQIPTLPLQEQPVVMPQVPQQVQPSPTLEAPVQGHPDAGVFVPDFAPQQELIPNPNYSPHGTIKLHESNPQLRNEIYLGPETNVRPLQIKNPTGEVPAEDADDGFSWSDYFRDAAISTYNYLVPRQFEMQAVPSVAGDVQRDLYRRGPSQYVGGMVFNQGGPVQHLNPGGRAGGKKKVWDSATQSYIWVGPSDPRHPGNTPTVNEDRVPRVNPNPAPFTFDLTPNMPVRPGQSEVAQPVSNTMVPPSPLEVPAMPGPMVDAEPIVVDAAPAPMSDEAILNTSSQVVEQREDNYPSNAQPGWRNLREGGQWQNPQAAPAPTPEQTPDIQDPAELERLRQNELLGDYARQFPEGDPRRAEAFNRQLHQKGAVHPAMPEDFTIPSDIPVVPLVTEDYPPLGNITDLSMLDEQEIAALYDAGHPAATAYAEREEELQLVSSALDQTNIDLAVANPSTVGYAVLKDRQATLKNRIAELSAPDSFGNEVPPPQLNIPDARRSMNEVNPTPEIPEDLGDSGGFGAVPGIDIDPVLTEDPRGPDQRQTVEAAQDSSKREATVRNKVAEVDEGEGPAPNINNNEAASKGAEVIANNPAEESKAMSTIRGFFGDLFTGDELKRAAVLFIGAMLTGATPGQALAFAGKDYLSRGESHDKYVKELMEEGDHTTASIKAYSKSKNLGDLVPKQAMRSGTGEYKDVWRPDGKRVRAMEVNLGPNNNIWVDAATGLKIPDTWEDDPKRIPTTPESNAAIVAAGESYGDMVNELQRNHASIEDSNETLTGLSPNVQGGMIAKWARDNEIDAAEMPGIIQNAYMDLLRDVKGGGKVVNDLRPYLNNQYVTAKSGASSELFTLTVGDNAGQSMSAEKISGVLISARSITSKSDDPLIKNRGDVDIIKAVMEEWEKLQDKSKYKASSTETPFFKFLKEQINS